MFSSHQLVGNLITLAMLRDGQGGNTTGTTPLFIIFLCTMTIGTVLMCFLSKRNGNEEEGLQDSSSSFCSSVVSLAKTSLSLLLDKRILLVIPLILYSGLQKAFVWADFTEYIVEPKLGVSGVGGAMAVYGTFGAICSLAAGWFTSSLSSITVIVFGGAVIQAIAFLLLLLKYSIGSGVLEVLYLLLIASFLGVGDGVLNTHISVLLGMLFKHNLEGAFAQFKLWQSLSIAVVFFMSPHVAFPIMVVIMLTALCVSVIVFLFLTLKVEGAFSNSV